VTTMVIERKTLPKAISSLFRSPHVHIRVEGGADRVLLTPANDADDDNCEHVDGPDSRYIDPDDYPDETAYVNAIPGLADMLIASAKLPRSEFKPVPRKFFNV